VRRSWKRPGWKRWNCWKACRRSWRRCPDGRLRCRCQQWIEPIWLGVQSC
jgi:hypothetical protein